MKKLCVALLLVVIQTADAFEIRPIGINGGAYGAKVNDENIVYVLDSQAHRCSNDWYLPALNTSPVHEAIIRKAYPFVYGQKLRVESWRSPLIAGVQWNDDPEQLLRRAYYYNAKDNILKFKRDESDASRPNTLTRRTHHGDLQFLHSMRMEREDDMATKKRMLRWLKYTYSVAIGDVNPRSIRKHSEYHELFGKVGCMRNPELENPSDCTVMDVFDIHRLHREGDDKIAIAQLATGAIAHMIQDSYSASHTLRENGVGKILKLYTYDDENRRRHCESDGLYEMNKPNIEVAIRRTADLLWLVKTKTPWEKAEPFFNEVFYFAGK